MVESTGRVIIVQRRERNEKNLLYELRELAEAAGYKVVMEIEQVRLPDSRYNIGAGKVEELARLVKENNIDRVIFFNELKPNQAYNLRKKLDVDVIDRYELILEVFAKRAGSREAKLQIELARLKKMLGLVREWISLAKRGEFPGFMAGGRYAIDAYYKYVSSRISRIENELEKLRKVKSRRWERRRSAGLYSIALTGYTGAGKTTLFRALTNVEGYSDGKPFATLSTKSRKIRIYGLPVLVSDTIGFIDSLPSALFDAFYTTLGEAALADIVVLVVDISEDSTEIKRKISASLYTLLSLGITKNRIIVAANKIDLINDISTLKERIDIIKDMGLRVVAISALKGLGLERLKQKIYAMLPGKVRAEIILRGSYDPNSIGEKCKVIKFEKMDGNIYLVIEGRREIIEKLKGKVGSAVTNN